jgi:hypothetical protein
MRAGGSGSSGLPSRCPAFTARAAVTGAAASGQWTRRGKLASGNGLGVENKIPDALSRLHGEHYIYRICALVASILQYHSAFKLTAGHVQKLVCMNFCAV